MERNPLQTVATINVTKLNHMDGIAKMCKIEMVFNADFFFISEFLSCSLSTLLLSFSVKMTYINYSTMLGEVLCHITYLLQVIHFSIITYILHTHTILVKRGLCSTKYIDEMLQNVLYFIKYNFFISYNFTFSLMNTLIYVDINQGIHS